MSENTADSETASVLDMSHINFIEHQLLLEANSVVAFSEQLLDTAQRASFALRFQKGMGANATRELAIWRTFEPYLTKGLKTSFDSVEFVMAWEEATRLLAVARADAERHLKHMYDEQMPEGMKEQIEKLEAMRKLKDAVASQPADVANAAPASMDTQADASHHPV